MIEQTNSTITYTADGVQTQWEYPYPFVEADDINLYVTISGVRTKISQDVFTFDTTTKKVTYPLVGDPVTSGAIVELTRETELTQLEDSSIVAFKSNDIERIADKLTLICQDTQRAVADAIAPEGGQIQEAVSEAISVHNNSASSHPLKEDKANKVTSISGSSTDTQYPSAKAVNTELDKKQPKALSESITINGTVITTVEEALNAINNNSAYKDLSNLSATGENHFVQLQSGVSQANVDYVIETTTSGTSWSRTYKSGWVEQGGLASPGVQVQFVKEFADTNYSISGIPDGGNNAQSATTVSCYNKTTTSIYFTTANNATNVIWEAKGYKAQNN